MSVNSVRTNGPKALGLKKVFLKTYGCQANVYDSERMLELLEPLGYQVSSEEDSAELVIFNTCHIREKAEHKLFSDLGRFKRIKQGREDMGQPCFLVVAGCTGQALGRQVLQRAPYVSAVVGPQTYHTLPEILTRLLRETDAESPQRVVHVGFPKITKFDELIKTRKASGPCAFLSIQEGCNKFCRFCVVPYTRGAEYSRPVQHLLEEARALVDQGVTELTLLGQNVNAYHGLSSSGEVWGLGRLIEALATLPELVRIRYTSSHPRDIDSSLLRAHGDVEKLVPFLHLPVQSGSDRILAHMNRRYTAEFYRNCLEQLRQARPGIAFSSDFIVGYPGETEEDFQDTCRLVEEVGFAQAYSFQYSPRPGTPASSYEDQVPEEVKKERLQRLQAILNAQQRKFNEDAVGKTLDILVERVNSFSAVVNAQRYWGKTLCMQSTSVSVPDSPQSIRPIPLGSIISVHITHGLGKNLKGILVEDE